MLAYHLSFFLNICYALYIFCFTDLQGQGDRNDEDGIRN